MMFKMTATAQRRGGETERQFGWQDMFVGPEADPRGIGGIFVHHGDERTVLAGYLHDYRLTLELKCAGLDADAMARRSVEPSDLSLLGLVRHLSDAERYWFRQVMAGQDAPARYRQSAGDDHDRAFSDAAADPAVAAVLRPEDMAAITKEKAHLAQVRTDVGNGNFTIPDVPGAYQPMASADRKSVV